MSLTINTRSYNLDRQTPDANSFAGPSHTITTNDKFEMKRVYPKASNGFRGVARPTAKLTKTVTINSVTGETADAIVTLSASLPVGMTEAAIDVLLADFSSFCASNDAKTLFKTLDITA